jgi:hypothetical protein
MAVNDKVTKNEYNNIRTKLVNVLSTGVGNSGWNMPIISSAVNEGNTVTINEWTNLGYDIINGYKHIAGTTPAVATVVEGGTIRYGTTFTPSSSDIPVTQYDQWANTIAASPFTVSGTSSITTNKGTSSSTWPGIYGATWTTKVTCTINVEFSTADKARYFFNSGGEIRFTASRSGGAGSTQNTSWTNLLSAAGTQAFGANKPGTGTSPNDGTNFYRCTNAHGIWYSTSASTPYSLNTYRIKARTPDVVNNSSGTARRIEFLVEWIDDHVGIAGGFDQVDGTISINVSTLEASQVLVPASAGNFTVESPTVAIGAVTT